VVVCLVDIHAIVDEQFTFLLQNVSSTSWKYVYGEHKCMYLLCYYLF
jgi:hypothetical protein